MDSSSWDNYDGCSKKERLHEWMELPPCGIQNYTEQKIHRCVHGWQKAEEISTRKSDAAFLQKTSEVLGPHSCKTSTIQSGMSASALAFGALFKLFLVPIHVTSEVKLCSNHYFCKQRSYWQCNMTTWHDGHIFFNFDWPSTVILKGKQRSETHRPTYQSKAQEKKNL